MQRAQKAARSLGEFDLMFEIGNLLLEITSLPDRINALKDLIRWGLRPEIMVFYEEIVLQVESYDLEKGWVLLHSTQDTIFADPRQVSIYNGM